MSKTLLINEVFYSPQGEGVRAGTMNVFVRFSKCNMECRVEEGPKSPGGFDCDTEFESGRRLTIGELHDYMRAVSHPACKWAILTGGEPGLQVTHEVVTALHGFGWKLAIETNGSIELPPGIDWITVSPKVAEHAIKQLHADEVKYVRGYGQAIPKTVVDAKHKLISPAFNGTDLDSKTLAWCLDLVRENPEWQLTMQMHKAMWGVQ